MNLHAQKLEGKFKCLTEEETNTARQKMEGTIATIKLQKQKMMQIKLKMSNYKKPDVEKK